MSNEIEKLTKILNESNNIVFFGGAGVSTESNIPDFRSTNGLWNEKLQINLTPEQYLVMDILWDAEVMSQQAIADIIQKDKNSVTKFIDSLEKKGLVYRQVNKTDRRVNNIVVSEEGMKLKARTTEVAIGMMRNVLKNIKEEDLMVLDKVMNQIKENIDEAGKEA